MRRVDGPSSPDVHVVWSQLRSSVTREKPGVEVAVAGSEARARSRKKTSVGVGQDWPCGRLAGASRLCED